MWNPTPVGHKTEVGLQPLGAKGPVSTIVPATVMHSVGIAVGLPGALRKEDRLGPTWTAQLPPHPQWVQ